MRRKPVPNPLSFAADQTDSLGEQSSADARAHKYPDPHAPGADRPRPRPSPSPSPRPTPSSEATLQVTSQVTSPTSSKSSRSPRSPFGKYGPVPSTVPATSTTGPASTNHSANTTTTRRPPPQHHLPYPADTVPPLQSPDDVQVANHRRHHSPQRREPEYRPPTHSSTYNPASTARDTTSRPEGEKHARSTSRFFNFGKTSKSSNHLYHTHAESASTNEAMSRGVENTTIPDRVPSKNSKHSDLSVADSSAQRSVASLPSKSEVSLTSAGEYETAASKKNKPNPFTILGRNRSFKDNDINGPKESITIKLNEPERDTNVQPLRTAPMNTDGYDRSFGHMMNSTPRNHSADRALPSHRTANKDHRHDKDYNRPHPPVKENNNAGSTFFNGLRSSGSRAADMISKGLFGRGVRSASTSDKDLIDDEHYVLKVINLPLVEQTRLTRISKRLEDSRDKTEFWMPAFPWRAIDYLNLKGTDVEGLYRVPGSGPQIKKWQRKFDEEYDVDLFAQEDLYDINIIGSMFKAWLRELPDELFPKEAQERISRQCAGAQEVPQLLVEELSNLSPFNYYLLFAITCHLSLLLAHSDKNKMDFRNLCICFQPCMKIDAFCFKFLVCDWRKCWQGCQNEAKYIEEEYQLFQQPLPQGLSSVESRSYAGSETHDDRNLSSSDSSKPSAAPTQQQDGKLKKKTGTTGQSNGMTPNYSTGSTLTVSGEHDTPRHRSGERNIRPLSPIKPLSPMNF